jgi:hypothetical protein
MNALQFVLNNLAIWYGHIHHLKRSLYPLPYLHFSNIFSIYLISQLRYGPEVDTASNRNESQNLPGVKAWLVCKADNLTVSCEPIV